MTPSTIKSFEQTFDVLVIGGGHAGTEAAVGAARCGATVGLITSSLESIGQMSCNPAIGGVAKGTVVKEVDALGGIMGRVTDLAMIQFRMLNRSKGPAVWAPRAQCDRGLYRRAARAMIDEHRRIHTIQGTVARLVLDTSGVGGVETLEGRRFGARCVVLTTGTFLRGRIHIGTSTTISGGRAGDAASLDLAEQMESLGLSVARFKTGTPPRIDGRSVDFSGLDRQESELDQFNYSWSHYWPDGGRARTSRTPDQLPCWITWLGEEGKRVVETNIAQSAMYGGAIASRGPRYCPSVEDKIVKFPDAVRHQIFLEPEGHDSAELYVNGLSTSLPVDVQLEVLRTIPGLAEVRMTRAGYAIEYDYFPPTQLDSSLQVKAMRGLYFAGQINGTTGYEEAAGQGLVAGINAALSALGRESLVLGRETSYIGVLVDDLVTRGVDEPYRLFTSRSEFRLTVRQDNALSRLAPIAERLALLDEREMKVVDRRRAEETTAMDLATNTSVRPAQIAELMARSSTAAIPHSVKLRDLARRPELSLLDLFQALSIGEELSAESVVTADLEIKYAGYFERERGQAEKMRRMGEFQLDPELGYETMKSLSLEARQKLARIRPDTLAQASRVPGISPSDLQNLLIEIERRRARTSTRE